MSAPLRVEDMNVSFEGPLGATRAVRGVSFAMNRERLGIVGESGSGKSTLARALLRLGPGRVDCRAMTFDGIDLLDLSASAMRALRGRRIAMIPQDPAIALNPVMAVGRQIVEACRASERVAWRGAKEKAEALLERVGIRDPERIFRAYPHELSGGMAQRAMIAMMVIAGPDLLIADEPTSALDLSVRHRVLTMLDELVTERGMGLIFISHDLDLIASFCDRIIVMYGGRILETCAAGELDRATHPYTRGLLAARPRLEEPRRLLRTLERDPAWLEDAP